ncbi:MAG: PASTA domain-containing protein [Clostridia bacterium]|nr:PASTA domain-containing protein [Clostridia bacterium]
MGFYNNLCPGCMNETEDYAVCPYCGFDMNARQMAPYLAYGTVLAGKYVVGDILETNSEGVTYLGLDTITNNCVRIREFLPTGFATRAQDESKMNIIGDETAYKGMLKDFLNIWHTLMKLRIMECFITVLDVFEANDTAYAVAEADGTQTLSDYLDENDGVLAWDVIKEKLFPVLDAVETLNGEGIIHGAVSPDTLFLCSDGKFKLWGFGIKEIRKAEGLLVADIRPGYAAIEQYANEMELSAATDVYGFVAVLYKCITGSMPVDAQLRYASDTLSIPAQFARELPDYVLAAFIGALQVSPSDRTSDIAMLKLSFTKEAFERQKLQAAAIANASLIDPISDMDAPDPRKLIKDPEPVLVSSPAGVTVLRNDTQSAGSTASTIVMSICIVLVMLIFFGCLALTGVISFNFGGGVSGKTVEMPNFENYMKDDPYILEVANTYGLQITLNPASSDIYAEGVVFEQNIAAGTKIAKGSQVVLTYSKGYSTVTLPEFIGMPVTETIYYLGRLNLSYNIVEKANPGGQKAGHVASITPAAGSVVYEETEITVEVWGDAPAGSGIVGPNTGSQITDSSTVIDSIFGSLSDSVSGLGDTIQNFFG